MPLRGDPGRRRAAPPVALAGRRAPAGLRGAGAGEGSAPRGPAEACGTRRASGERPAGRSRSHRGWAAAPAPVTAAPRRPAARPTGGRSLSGAAALPRTSAAECYYVNNSPGAPAKLMATLVLWGIVTGGVLPGLHTSLFPRVLQVGK